MGGESREKGERESQAVPGHGKSILNMIFLVLVLHLLNVHSLVFKEQKESECI